MSKRKRTHPNRGPLTLLVVGAAVAAGLAVYIKTTGADRIPPELVRKPTVAARSGDDQTSGASTVYYYDPSRDWRPVAVTVAEGQGPAKTAVTAYLQAVGSDVKLLSADIRGGNAVLNFSGAFSGMGSMEEGRLAEGVLRILGQFPNVKTADLLSNGETMETGHQVYDKMDVIRPRSPSAPVGA